MRNLIPCSSGPYNGFSKGLFPVEWGILTVNKVVSVALGGGVSSENNISSMYDFLLVATGVATRWISCDVFTLSQTLIKLAGLEISSKICTELGDGSIDVS